MCLVVDRTQHLRCTTVHREFEGARRPGVNDAMSREREILPRNKGEREKSIGSAT